MFPRDLYLRERWKCFTRFPFHFLALISADPPVPGGRGLSHCKPIPQYDAELTLARLVVSSVHWRECVRNPKQ